MDNKASSRKELEDMSPGPKTALSVPGSRPDSD